MNIYSIKVKNQVCLNNKIATICKLNTNSCYFIIGNIMTLKIDKILIKILLSLYIKWKIIVNENVLFLRRCSE